MMNVVPLLAYLLHTMSLTVTKATETYRFRLGPPLPVTTTGLELRPNEELCDYNFYI